MSAMHHLSACHEIVNRIGEHTDRFVFAVVGGSEKRAADARLAAHEMLDSFFDRWAAMLKEGLDHGSNADRGTGDPGRKAK